MKEAETFSELKIDTAQAVLSLKDPGILAKVRSILAESRTSLEDIVAIKRSQAECLEGKFTTAEEFLREVADL